MTRLETILRAQRGRYLWGVSLGEGSLLSWQVGDPHLHVEMGRTVDGFEQRFAQARGHWQVEVLDGSVELLTAGGTLRLSGAEPAPAHASEVLELFEGQALVRCELSEELVLRFDLEAELKVGGAHALVRVAGPEGEGEWRA